MTKGKIALLLAAIGAFCFYSVANADQITDTTTGSGPDILQSQQGNEAAERITPANAPNTENETWQELVYGSNWQREREKIAAVLPEFAAGLAIVASAPDTAEVTALPVDTAQNIVLAINRYYMLLDKIVIGYAGRKFKIAAARRIDGYILLWLEEPEVMDGGRAIIYSVENNRIVADFYDGGLRG